MILAVAFQAVAQTTDKPADLTTTTGKTYKQARVFRVEPDGITYMYAGGMSKIPFTELPEAVRKQYNYDPAAAKAFSAQDDAQQSQLAAAGQAVSADVARTKQESAKSSGDAEKEKATFDKAVAVSPNFTGDVLEKHAEGMEVHLRTKTYDPTGHSWGGTDGIIFLRGYPDQDKVADSDVIKFKLVPDGSVTMGRLTLHVYRYAASTE